VHTHYSILDGAAPIKKLIARASMLGMKALAITDHGNMYGAYEFHTAATKAGIKPILGCEVYVARTSRFDKSSKSDRGGDHLILLAKNEAGYRNLIKLVSYGWTEGLYYNPRIDKELLAQYHEGIICSSACLGGEIPGHIMDGNMDLARQAIKFYKDLFGDDYYLEMQFHPSGDPQRDANVFNNQILVNKAIRELSAEFGVKYIATNDSHFVEADDAPAHDRLICLATARDLDDPSRMRYSGQEWLKSEEEMTTLFGEQYPLALSNTEEITDKIEEYSLTHKPYMPDFEIPADFVIDQERIDGDLAKMEAESSEKQKQERIQKSKEQQYLESIARAGAAKRYGSPLPKAVEERLTYELQTIEWMGFPGYFLIVWDFIKAAREIGVSVGPGRGSAAGSVVSYTLGITNIEPMRYGLLFERFLNPERISMPDVDIDFDEDGREKVLHYVVGKYGQKRVAHIITFGTMAAKSSIRDVARVQKLDLRQSDRLAKLVPDTPGTTLEKAYKEVPELADERNSDNEQIRDTLKYAEKLEGTVRQTGVHACGVIIGKDDLEKFAPMCTAKEAELYVVQYEGGLVESIGLLKMDFLGLRTLSIIKDALDNIKLSTDKDLDINNIPLDDKKTLDLYCAGDTTGLFQFESPGMKKHLRNLKPSCFEDLIAMNALYRPGPMEYIPNFIARKHGREEIVYDVPEMEEVLKETYGITVYQEQVMLLSQRLGGFTKGQADTLRKAMGKKQRETLDKMKPKFIEGAAKNGHPADVCEKIWKDWEAFAQYAFNKSHSTCYAYISYQTAYLKAHYPSEYMAAVLSRNLSDIKKISFFMDECRRMNAPVLGPDVNYSYEHFAVDALGNIRFGMAGIKGVGQGAVEAIVAERKANGKFKDIFDFVERANLTSVNKKAMECLALSGAFDAIYSGERSDFFAPSSDGKGNFIEQLVRYGTMVQNEKNEAQNSLFGALASSSMVQKPSAPTGGESWGKLEMLEKEREVIGIYLSSHPLDDFRVVLEKYCTASVGELEDLAALNGRDLILGGMITSVQNLTTKTGKPFGRFTIEDLCGSYTFTLFSREWEQFRYHCMAQSTVLIRCKIEQSTYREGCEINISQIKPLSDVLEKDIHTLTIKLPIEEVRQDFVEELSAVISSSKGGVSLVFNVCHAASGVYVPLRSRTGRVELNSEITSFLETNALEYRIS
ncbi:MAG: DNA polymerase III subunit alpha, partial [Mucinivorans sp.]